jgi:hypothetical protein
MDILAEINWNASTGVALGSLANPKIVVKKLIELIVKLLDKLGCLHH